VIGAAGVAVAALICIDPGHGTPAAVGRQLEPIGPGSHVMKIKDGGGAHGEAAVALAIAQRARAVLIARGYRVAMTRTGGIIGQFELIYKGTRFDVSRESALDLPALATPLR